MNVYEKYLYLINEKMQQHELFKPGMRCELYGEDENSSGITLFPESGDDHITASSILNDASIDVNKEHPELAKELDQQFVKEVISLRGGK